MKKLRIANLLQGQDAEGPSTMSLKTNVKIQLARAIQEVERLKELQSLLERNPEINRIMELMGRKY